MLHLRPYRDTDAPVILSWCRNEVDFYKWTAGMLGPYPISEKEFSFVTSLRSFTAVDEDGIAGFFALRAPHGTPDELRFGFVIVDPQKRGQGYGKAMLRLGLRYVFEDCGAKRASLGVFENNAPAYFCYKAAGFRDVPADKPGTYPILGEDWRCLELALER